MKKKKIFYIAAVFLTSAVMTAGCKSDKEYKVIKIGAVIDITGSNAGPSWPDAIKLAATHWNGALKETGYKNMQFEVDIDDDAQDMTIAVTRAQHLAQAGAKALIAGSSENNMAIIKTYYDDDTTNDMNIPVQCGSCTSDSINNPDKKVPSDLILEAAYQDKQEWNLRSNMAAKLVSKVIIRTLLLDGDNGDINNDQLFRVSIIAINDTWGVPTASQTVQNAQTLRPDARTEVIFYDKATVETPGYNWTSVIESLIDNTNVDSAIDDSYPDAIIVVAFASHAADFWNVYQGTYTTPVVFFHTARVGSVLTSLGSKANDMKGVSHVLLDDSISGATFAADLKEKTGVDVQYRDSIFYDAAATFMLATVIAIKDLEDPTLVTGAQIRDVLRHFVDELGVTTRPSLIGDPAGTKIRCGTEEFIKAINLIQQGQAIDYEGPSGPMDYDAYGNVKNKLALWKVIAGKYVDIQKFDCITSTDCTYIPQ